eukprot:Awhi_evm1s537
MYHLDLVFGFEMLCGLTAGLTFYYAYQCRRIAPQYSDFYANCRAIFLSVGMFLSASVWSHLRFPVYEEEVVLFVTMTVQYIMCVVCLDFFIVPYILLSYFAKKSDIVHSESESIELKQAPLTQIEENSAELFQLVEETPNV